MVRMAGMLLRHFCAIIRVLNEWTTTKQRSVVEVSLETDAGDMDMDMDIRCR